MATFHTATARSRAMSAASGLLRPSMEKISARIAVSELARETLVQHVGGEPMVIPNGLFVDRFALAPPRPEWLSDTGTIVFLGRLDEPRKGLHVLLAAFPEILRRRPGTRLLVVGRGDAEEGRAMLPADVRDAVSFLGMVDDPTRAQALASADLYVAPHTGGESFGITLVEAMAAGAPVLASDLRAFALVLQQGRLGTAVPGQRPCRARGSGGGAAGGRCPPAAHPSRGEPGRAPVRLADCRPPDTRRLRDGHGRRGNGAGGP